MYVPSTFRCWGKVHQRRKKCAEVLYDCITYSKERSLLENVQYRYIEITTCSFWSTDGWVLVASRLQLTFFFAKESEKTEGQRLLMQ